MSRAGGGAAGNGLRVAGGAHSYGGLLSTMGENTVVAGIPSRRLRLLWIAFIPKGENTADNLITVRFEDSADVLYLGYALAHRQ